MLPPQTPVADHLLAPARGHHMTASPERIQRGADPRGVSLLSTGASPSVDDELAEGGPDHPQVVTGDPEHRAGLRPGHSQRNRGAAAGPGRTSTEVAKLRQVLEDVQFSLERGSWQAALAATRAVLTHDAQSNTSPDIGQR